MSTLRNHLIDFTLFRFMKWAGVGGKERNRKILGWRSRRIDSWKRGEEMATDEEDGKYADDRGRYARRQEWWQKKLLLKEQVSKFSSLYRKERKKKCRDGKRGVDKK